MKALLRSGMLLTLFLFVYRAGATASPTDKPSPVRKKIDLRVYITSNSYEAVVNLMKKYQTSKEHNSIQNHLITLYNIIKDNQPTQKDYQSMHKILVMLRCCAQPPVLKLYKEVIASGANWVLRQEALKNLASFPTSTYLDLLVNHLSKEKSMFRDDIIKHLGQIKAVQTTPLLCKFLSYESNQYALEAMVLFNSPSATKCLINYAMSPRFNALSQASQKDLLTLATLVEKLTQLTNRKPTYALSFRRLFHFYQSSHPLLKKNVHQLVRQYMDLMPKQFVRQLRDSNPKTRLAFIPDMGQSTQIEVISYLADLSCCAKSQALKQGAQNALKIKKRAL